MADYKLHEVWLDQSQDELSKLNRAGVPGDQVLLPGVSDFKKAELELTNGQAGLKSALARSRAQQSLLHGSHHDHKALRRYSITTSFHSAPAAADNKMSDKHEQQSASELDQQSDSTQQQRRQGQG